LRSSSRDGRERHDRQRVGNDRRRLPGLHSCELVFLEIRVDPEAVCWNDGQQICALQNIGADLSGAVADIAANGCTDFGITEIESRGLQIGLCLRNRSGGLVDVSAQHA
jgi:hypothetical protein